MAEAGLMPQRPWHSRQSDGEVMDGADDCDEQKGFFPEWTVFVRGGNETDRLSERAKCGVHTVCTNILCEIYATEDRDR